MDKQVRKLLNEERTMLILTLNQIDDHSKYLNRAVTLRNIPDIKVHSRYIGQLTGELDHIKETIETLKKLLT